MVLVPNFGLRKTISKTTKIHPQTLQKLHVCAHGMCMVLVPNFGLRTTILHYTKTPTVLQKFKACVVGMCMVLVPNFGLRTSISNTTQIHPQHFRNFMCVRRE